MCRVAQYTIQATNLTYSATAPVQPRANRIVRYRRRGGSLHDDIPAVRIRGLLIKRDLNNILPRPQECTLETSTLRYLPSQRATFVRLSAYDPNHSNAPPRTKYALIMRSPHLTTIVERRLLDWETSPIPNGGPTLACERDIRGENGVGTATVSVRPTKSVKEHGASFIKPSADLRRMQTVTSSVRKGSWERRSGRNEGECAHASTLLRNQNARTRRNSEPNLPTQAIHNAPGPHAPTPDIQLPTEWITDFLERRAEADRVENAAREKKEREGKHRRLGLERVDSIELGSLKRKLSLNKRKEVGSDFEARIERTKSGDGRTLHHSSSRQEREDDVRATGRRKLQKNPPDTMAPPKSSIPSLLRPSIRRFASIKESMLSSSILRKLRFSSDSCEQTQDQGIVRSVSFRASKVFEGGRKTSVKILDRDRKSVV